MHTSPSALRLAATCDRAHAYRYVLGLREPERAWADVAQIPRPIGATAVRAWNSMRRAPLGKETHRILQRWYESFLPSGALFDAGLWDTEPGRIAFAGLRLLPHPETLTAFACEEQIPADFVAWATDGEFDFEIKSFVDLSAVDRAQRVLLFDYKTTSNFRWMRSATELACDDQQGLIYPLHAMRKYSVDAVECCWLYFRTERPYAARAVHFQKKLIRAKALARPLFARGAELIERVRLKIAPESLHANPTACIQYGRVCEYHHELGGLCHPEQPTPGQSARIICAQFIEKEREIMGFKRAAVAAGALEKESEKESETEANETEANETEANETEASAAGDARAPKPKRSYRRARGADDSDIGSVSLLFADGSTIVLPDNSPLYARALAVHSALFGGAE